MKLVLLKNVITFVALGLIVLHIFKPHIAIDSITLGLLVLAIIPWLTPLFKSLQLPGGVKIEYQDFEKTEKQIQEAGLLSKKTAKKQYDFLPAPTADPTLAVAWLRIEIEKRLLELARKNKLPEYRDFDRNIDALFKKKIIKQEEVDALVDLSDVLKMAINEGAVLDHTITEWVIEMGPRLLIALDNKIKKK